MPQQRGKSIIVGGQRDLASSGFDSGLSSEAALHRRFIPWAAGVESD